MLYCGLLLGFLGLLSPAAAAGPPTLPQAQTVGALEAVAYFYGPMPTGVTVSHEGRIFVSFPRWGDDVEYTVAEVKDGAVVPYPGELINQLLPGRPSECLVSVQSVVVDPKDRLWILDTGSIAFGPTSYGGPKLVGVDLKKNRIFQKILLPPEVARPTTYLNDVRFDLRRGKEGLAFITDSSGSGPNALIVVDLASGKSWRKLNNHPSTRPEPGFVPIVEGRVLMRRPPDGPAKPFAVGADGIALGHDGQRVFYCPLSSRRLYSVSADALADASLPEDKVAATVVDHGEKGASDGLESDSQNRLYATNYEHNGILRRSPDGAFETLVYDPRVLWPDTLSLATDGYLYFTVNQLQRQPGFHRGQDLRQKPYTLFRVKVEAAPVLLK
jgi:sugar lactone lactonase YvrE